MELIHTKLMCECRQWIPSWTLAEQQVELGASAYNAEQRPPSNHFNHRMNEWMNKWLNGKCRVQKQTYQIMKTILVIFVVVTQLIIIEQSTLNNCKFLIKNKDPLRPFLSHHTHTHTRTDRYLLHQIYAQIYLRHNNNVKRKREKKRVRQGCIWSRTSERIIHSPATPPKVFKKGAKRTNEANLKYFISNNFFFCFDIGPRQKLRLFW